MAKSLLPAIAFSSKGVDVRLGLRVFGAGRLNPRAHVLPPPTRSARNLSSRPNAARSVFSTFFRSVSSVFDPEGNDRRSIRVNFIFNYRHKLVEDVKWLAGAIAAMDVAL